MKKIIGDLQDTQQATTQATTSENDKSVSRQTMMTDTMQRSKTYAEEMYQKIESNTVSLVFAKNNKDAAKQKQCELTERKIINDVLAAPVEHYNCFMMLFIAEYKERTYWSICDLAFDEIESDIFDEYSRIFTKNCIWDCMAKCHKLDPTHFMFVGKHYQFYDALEFMGYNILNMSEDEVYKALYAKYDN